jgi:hypothetical protein
MSGVQVSNHIKLSFTQKTSFISSYELTEITGSMAVKFQHFYCGSHKVSCVLYVYRFTVDDIRDQLTIFLIKLVRLCLKKGWKEGVKV